VSSQVFDFIEFIACRVEQLILPVGETVLDSVWQPFVGDFFAKWRRNRPHLSSLRATAALLFP
jgi:hypothetical protein